MEALKSLFEEFDMAAFLPDMTTVVGWIESVLRVAVMAGPLLLLGFGLLFLLAPPKEANYGVGFRCWWGMASLEAWQFTQRLAGLVWSGMGVALTVIMALICNAFRRQEPTAMVWTAVICLGVELFLILASYIAINIVLIRKFDRWGFRRDEEIEE